MRKTLLILIACFSLLGASAQDRTINGKVTSAQDGQGLPGVAVLVKGTSAGTTTDAGGNYVIGVPASGTVLQFSFIGMVSQEVEISRRSVIDVSLTEDVKQLSEVVVVGYGTQERQNVTDGISPVRQIPQKSE